MAESRYNKEAKKDQLISKETAEFAKQLGFDWSVDQYYPAKFVYNFDDLAKTGFPAATQSVLQKWLRETYNHDVVPVRIENHMDNGLNYKIYLNGREWHCDGVCIVEAGYEACLEIGLKKSLRYLIDRNEQYNRNEQSGN